VPDRLWRAITSIVAARMAARVGPEIAGRRAGSAGMAGERTI
jgi:hypothetical protein